MSYTAADMTAPAQNKLRAWRIGQNKSVNEAAAEIGCTRQTWYSWERGLNIPSPELMPKLVAMTGGTVTANDFYDLTTHGHTDTPLADSASQAPEVHAENPETLLTASRSAA